MGRPKNINGQMTIFSCRIPKELDKEIMEYIKDKSAKPSDVMRLIVQRGFDNIKQGR